MIDRKKIRLFILAATVTLIGMFVYYAGTHGRITVKNLGSETISLVQLQGTTRSEIRDVRNGAIVTSGTYIARNTQGDTDRLARIKVPGWFQGVEITYSGNISAKTSRIAAFTYENFFPANNGSLVSFSDLNSYAAGYTSHPQDDVFGGKYSDTSFDEELHSPVITSEGTLLGIHDSQLLRYSFTTNTAERIGTLAQPTRVQAEEDVTLIPKIKRSSDLNSNRIGIYEKVKNTLKISGNDGTFTSYDVKVDNARGIAFDTNDRHLAIVNMTSKNPEGAAAEDEEAPLTYSVHLYDTERKKTSELQIGEAIAVSDIALSPSGTFIAAIKDGELWIYNTTTNEVVMAHPFTSINQLFWNKNKLYALSSETGINVFNTDTLQLNSMNLGQQDDISFSDFTPVGTKLYATAYNVKQDSKLPDGYVIDLETPSNGITEVLAKKLPFRNDSYDINYLNNTIYVRVNFFPRDGASAESQRHMASLKKQAQMKVEELIPADTLRRSTVVFVN